MIRSGLTFIVILMAILVIGIASLGAFVLIEELTIGTF